MQELKAMDIAKEVMDIIKRGAFLTVKAGKKINTMTIGWATIGHIWKKDVFMVAVRESRHTFDLIEKSDNFTVSVPASGYKKEVLFCGTKSGRDFNKFEECNLKTATGKFVESPIIDIPGYHFECKIIYKNAMDPKFLDAIYDKSLYSDKDYHTLYFGEIAVCYKTE
ncbi:MAG: flavin reductase family protein [Proteobacteria bacterium]|nr:flavin reductase family protein [Pseudomonadota bacterium]MBU1584562.1 flavin reductase family protein [Pseudomonadota bacterium]MBU2453238.1 flavin reductase family protein [Pseudomonadota bacterium]MBU2631830.1 flavin reductase family protein [Pseudomonadota bacterium]